jgi:hypothetical protein
MEQIELSNNILMKLAFQRGLLTLMREDDEMRPTIDKALKDLDWVMDKLG